MRPEKEILDKEKINEILTNCDYMNIAFECDGAPYVLPMNFGFVQVDGKIRFYLHSSKRGKKTQYISKKAIVGFCMTTATKLVIADMACKCTMKFESICGRGHTRVIEGEEKVVAFEKIMQHYAPEKAFAITDAVTNSVLLWSIEVDELTAKSNWK